MNSRTVLVAGAGGAVGFEIVKALLAQGFAVTATYRTPRDGLADRIAALGATPAEWNIADAKRGRELLEAVDCAILTPILTVSEQVAAQAADKRLVFFSSNNVEIDSHAPVYAALRAAEGRVLKAAPDAAILRPTMIYGYPGDGNLSVLMRAMGRWPAIPMIGAGRALQQPVFYRDVAEIAAGALTSQSPGVIAVAGPAPVTQTELYRAVRDGAGGTGPLLPVPRRLAGAAARAAAVVGLRTALTPAQIARADLNKTPVGDNVVYGSTTLAEGLRDLARALDDTPPGA